METNDEIVKYQTKDSSWQVVGFTPNETFNGELVIPESRAGMPVASIADYAFANESSLRSVVLPGSIKRIGASAFEGSRLESIVFSEGLEKIDARAFARCEALQIVELPNSVKEIGRRAFERATALGSVLLPGSLKKFGAGAFAGAHNLKEFAFGKECEQFEIVDGAVYTKDLKTIVAYPSGSEATEYAALDELVSIGPQAFAGAKNLEFVDFNRATGGEDGEIGAFAFEDCARLADVSLSEDLAVIGRGAFANCVSLDLVEIPDGVSALPASAFENCLSLREISLPQKLGAIGRRAFKNCVALEAFIAPQALSVIESECFADCASLVELDLCRNIKRIQTRAFYNCRALETVRLPNGLAEIDSLAFENCSGLALLTLPEKLASLGDAAFLGASRLETIDVDPKNANFRSDGGVLFSKDKSTLLRYPPAKADPSYAVPTETKIIAPYAFADATKLVAIVLPNEVESLGRNAFQGCSSLLNIVLPQNLETIPSEIFKDCVKLPTLALPDSVVEIGDYAFSGCASLAAFVASPNVARIGDFAFEKCRALTTLEIPSEIESIGSNPFRECGPIDLVMSNGAVGRYVVLNGGLFNREKESLVAILQADADLNLNQYDLREIGAFACCDRDEIESVLLPRFLERIGTQAFANCRNLREFRMLEDGEAYFVRDAALYADGGKTLVAYPSAKEAATADLKDVSLVRAGAFAGARNLRGVDFGDAPTTIEYRAFYGASFLEKATNAQSATSIGSEAFVGTALMAFEFGSDIDAFAPDSFEPTVRLYAEAGSYAHTLGELYGREIELYENPFKQDEDALRARVEKETFDCEPVEGGIKLKRIKRAAREIEIPETIDDLPVIALGAGALADATETTVVKIPNGLATIEPGAFAGATALKSIEVAENSANFASEAGVLFSKDKTRLVSYPAGRDEKAYVVPATVKTIDARAFFSAKELVSIVLLTPPDSIGERAFAGCESLVSFTLPPIKTLAEGVFENCRSLAVVSLPSTLEEIGPLAFAGCARLSATSLPDSLKKIADDAFQGCAALGAVPQR